jgi:uncharacterized protein (TIRG00374 family)
MDTAPIAPPPGRAVRSARVIRSPRYIPVAVYGAIVILVGAIVLPFAGQQIRDLQQRIATPFKGASGLALRLIPSGMFIVTALLIPISAFVVLLVLRRQRQARAVLLAAIIGALADVGVAVGLQRFFSFEVLGAIGRITDKNPLPTQFTLTGLVAVLVLAQPWGSRRWIRLGWWAIALSTLSRVLLTDLPAGPVVLMLGIGVLVGALVGLFAGDLGTPLAPVAVSRAAARVGITLVNLRPTRVPRSARAAWIGRDPTGQEWLIHSASPDQGTMTRLRQAARAAMLRGTGDRAPARNLRRLIEHRLLVQMVAEASGAAVPHPGGLGSDGDEILFFQHHLVGTRLSRLSVDDTRAAIPQAWAQVAKLHERGVRHGDLILDNFLIDPDGHVWVVDFSDGEIDCDSAARSTDIVNLLASTAAVIGAEEAVDLATAAVGRSVVATSLPRLQPAGLRRSARQKRAQLAELRKVASAKVGVEEVELAQLRRLKPRTLLGFGMLGGAVYVLLPQFASAGAIFDQLRSAQLQWVALALVAFGLTYVGAGRAIVGSVPDPVPFGWAMSTAMASSFTNSVAPAGMGGVALGVRFLQRLGVPTPVALSGTLLNTLCGLVVHIILMAATVLTLGRTEVLSGVKIPWATVGWVLLGVVLVLLALASLRPIRARVRKRFEKPVREALASLADLVRSPLRLVSLVGGSALVTCGYATAFVLCARAVGLSAPISELVIVYLTAAIITTVAPTPGGLGAAEAAYAAGLAAVGYPGGQSLACVLIFRGVTFWVPILPGYLMLKLLERRGMV